MKVEADAGWCVFVCSDGGRFNERVEVAVKHAMDMASLGAAIVDVGGESTR